MNAPAGNVYLHSCLAPLAEWLALPDVTDLYINRPGELWVERHGAAPQCLPAPELTRDLLARLVRQIAALSAQGISREHPLLAASLPSGERVQAAIPPATRGEIAIAIRKHVVADIALDAFAAPDTGLAPLAPLAAPGGERRFVAADPARAPDILREAVRTRRNVLISGGTSSGKTTLANALIKEIPTAERLILIEDTPELKLVHPNAIGLIAARGALGEAAVTAEDLLIASLRLRPDRIILGELRGSEAVTYLRAVNTGHPGSLTTIHADSPDRAIDQLVLLVLQTGTRMGWDDVARYIRNSVDVIVQVDRVEGARRITALLVAE